VLVLSVLEVEGEIVPDGFHAALLSGTINPVLQLLRKPLGDKGLPAGVGVGIVGVIQRFNGSAGRCGRCWIALTAFAAWFVSPSPAPSSWCWNCNQGGRGWSDVARRLLWMAGSVNVLDESRAGCCSGCVTFSSCFMGCLLLLLLRA
jgi:hypothetical protein